MSKEEDIGLSLTGHFHSRSIMYLCEDHFDVSITHNKLLLTHSLWKTSLDWLNIIACQVYVNRLAKSIFLVYCQFLNEICCYYK